MNNIKAIKAALVRQSAGKTKSFSRGAVLDFIARRTNIPYNQLFIDGELFSSNRYNNWLNNNWFRIENQRIDFNSIDSKVNKFILLLKQDVARMNTELTDVVGYTFQMSTVLKKRLRYFYCNIPTSRKFFNSISKDPIVDPKTNLTLDSSYQLDHNGLVLSLPVNHKYDFVIKDLIIDTSYQLIGYTDIQYDISDVQSFLKGRPLILRYFKDVRNANNNLADYLTPIFTLDFDFGNQIVTNKIIVDSKQIGSTSILSIEYYDGGWRTYDSSFVSLFSNEIETTLFLKLPIISSRIRIKFMFVSNVSNYFVSDFDGFKKNLNDLLDLNGFTNDSAPINKIGSYFEYVVNKIDFSYVVYKHIGYTASQIIDVDRIRSFYYRQLYSGVTSAVSDNIFLNDRTRFTAEAYLKLNFTQNQTSVFNTTIPIINTRRRMQKRAEILVLQNNIAKLSFFPVTTSSILVYNSKNGLLTIGVDYQISFDSGATWQSDYTLPANFVYLAGNCLIKFNNSQFNSKYGVVYEILPNQYLESSRKIQLIGYSVVLDDSIKKLPCQIQVIEVLRSPLKEVGATPILAPTLFGVK